LTEIYLCNVCSCHEILRRNGRGQLMRGFLKKNRPKGLRLLWQKRYFILDHDFLRYYDPAEVQQVLRQRALSVPKTARVAPKGELPLRAIGAVVRETETEFTIQMQSGDFEAEREPYKLSAGSTVRPSVLCVCHPPPPPPPSMAGTLWPNLLRCKPNSHPCRHPHRRTCRPPGGGRGVVGGPTPRRAARVGAAPAASGGGGGADGVGATSVASFFGGRFG
jgi:hypothetical protein